MSFNLPPGVEESHPHFHPAACARCGGDITVVDGEDFCEECGGEAWTREDLEAEAADVAYDLAREMEAEE